MRCYVGINPDLQNLLRFMGSARSNEQTRTNRALGFTMIEMTIVLIMIGILTASLAPLILRQHNNTMEERDRVALENAKTAIINYAGTNNTAYHGYWARDFKKTNAAFGSFTDFTNLFAEVEPPRAA